VNEYISFLSIPRDLYVEYPDGKDNKINGLYAKYAFKHQSKEKGIAILKRKISQITGEKIDYYVNIDFNGFIKTVDAIGGVDITVPQNFVDTQYPDGNW
jgi:LCP family protein required for cell wall assembly